MINYQNVSEASAICKYACVSILPCEIKSLAIGEMQNGGGIVAGEVGV